MQVSKTQRLLSWMAFGLLFLTGAVLGIRQLREPDLWWQLRTGEWIREHGKVMDHDIFSFTFSDVSWINVKWGFEVLLTWLSGIGGPEFMLLWQVLANVLILYFFYRCRKALRLRNGETGKTIPSAVFIFFGYVLLLACEFRLNGRPEMVSHVFTFVFLYVLLRHSFSPGKWLYVLIPLQILWANLHEAFGIGLVMLIVFTAASWFEYLFLKKYSSLKTAPATITIVMFLVALAPALHPYGPKMILHPLEIFSQVGENKFTTELFSFSTPEYWQKEAYINIALFILALASLYISPPSEEQSSSKKKKKVRKPLKDLFFGPVKTYGAAYPVFLVMFFYLGLTAYRNIPFSVIVATPVAVIGVENLLAAWAARKNKIASPSSVAYLACIALGVAAYIAVASNFYYQKIDDGRDKYGLKTDPIMNPVGAAAFVAEHHIEGPAFSDFLVPNYFLWALQPNFKTFIDLRDLDIFTAEFFDKFAYLNFQPEQIASLDSQYHFSYALVYRPRFENLHNYFARQGDWTPVYADPVAVVYLKNDRHPDLVQQYKGTDFFHEPMELKPSGAANAVSFIFNPFYHSNKDIPVENDLIAADYYRGIGHYALAEKRAGKATQDHSEAWKGYEMLGSIYLKQYMETEDTTQEHTFMAKSMEAYNAAIAGNREAVQALIGLARLDMEQGSYLYAENRLKKALEVTRSERDIYLLLAQLQVMLSNQSPGNEYYYLEQRADYLQSAYDLDPEDLYIQFYLGLEYAKLSQCDKAEKYLKELLKFPGVPEEDREMAKGLMFQCGKGELAD